MFLPPGGYSADTARTQHTADAEKIRRRLGAGNKIITYVGHVAQPPYRLDLLVGAAKILLSSRSDLRFLVVGDGVSSRKLKSDVRKLALSEAFAFAGPQPFDSVPMYLNATDIALQLAGDICLGTKVISYMASKKAIVACGESWNQYKEFLLNEVNCLLVPPEQESLSDAIGRLLDNEELRRDLGENAFRTVQKYEWGNQARIILDKIDELEKLKAAK